MSFGRRLLLFSLLIVVLPMLAVGGLLLQVTAESGRGEADARLAAGLTTALAIERQEREEALPLARELAQSAGVAAALRDGDRASIQSEVDSLAAHPGVAGAAIVNSAGALVESADAGGAVAYAEVQLKDEGSTLGRMAISRTLATELVQRVARLTGREVAIVRGGEVVAGTTELAEDAIPPSAETAEVTIDGQDQRVRSIDAGGPGPGHRLVMVGPIEDGGLPDVNLGVAALLVVLLGLALAFTFVLARTLQRLHELVSEQAATDELTGLSNQRRFRELLAKEVERARRFQHPLSLLMLDLDDFKQVNDTYGHLQGDDVLRALASAVQRESREVDEPARYGGEELAVALPETDNEGATQMAERIRDRVGKTKVRLRGRRGSIGVTVSVGVATMPASASEPEGLIAAADRALYDAKRRGKDRVATARKAGRKPRRAARRRPRKRVRGSTA